MVEPIHFGRRYDIADEHDIEECMSGIPRRVSACQESKSRISIFWEKVLLAFPSISQEAAFKDFYHARLPRTLVGTSVLGLVMLVLPAAGCGDRCRNKPKITYHIAGWILVTTCLSGVVY